MRLTLSIALLLLLGTLSFAQAPLLFTGFDLNPGKHPSQPMGLMPFKDHFIFTANTDTAGYELWISDGTKAGTRMVKDIWPGKKSSNPHGFIEMKDKLYFSAYDTFDIECLWVTDGTDEGTAIVKRISPGHLAPYPFKPVLLGDKLLFEGDDSTSGIELWISDGTAAGTRMLKDINPGPNGYPTDLIPYKNKVIFNTYYNGNSDVEPWITDGTNAGTTMLMDICPGFMSSSASSFTICGDKLFFIASDFIHGQELWVTDGTTAGTQMVKDINPAKAHSMGLGGLTTWKGKLYFDVTRPTGNELWCSDGTEQGTKMITQIYAKLIDLSALETRPLAVGYKEKLYMVAAMSDTGAYGIYYTDGTDTGTRALVLPDPANQYRGVYSMTEYNGTLYFTDRSSLSGLVLHRSDGITWDTTILGPGPGPELFGWMNQPFKYQGALWFCANFDTTGYELWRMEDTTGIRPIPPFAIFPNPNNGNFTINTGEADFSGEATFYDAAGRYMSTRSVKGGTVKMSIPAPAAGVYFMRLISKKSLDVYKIVVNK